MVAIVGTEIQYDLTVLTPRTSQALGYFRSFKYQAHDGLFVTYPYITAPKSPPCAQFVRVFGFRVIVAFPETLNPKP